jgi:hypothetical protein
LQADNHLKNIQEQLGESWIPHIYMSRILKLRTRSYHFENLKQGARVAIQHTLLGIELKVGRRRLLCPDLASARYLAVFARTGCADVAIPYDITKISILADELESSWYRMLLLAEQAVGQHNLKLLARLRGLLFAKIRSEVAAAGSGTTIPEFRDLRKRR